MKSIYNLLIMIHYQKKKKEKKKEKIYRVAISKEPFLLLPHQA